ncbi:MAG: bifunctional riboflavin kinase/FAD synthetase [Planctomycetaceae bacterium]
MQTKVGFENPEAYSGGCLSIGNFDGVHRGHQRMLHSLVSMSRRYGVPAVVMTFDPPPIAILSPGLTPPAITSAAQKQELIAKCGVDCLIIYPTNRTLLGMSPGDFFHEIVQKQVAARGIVEGPNFYFGKNRAGTVHVLQELGAASGIDVEIVPPLQVESGLISSTAIRQAISAGDVIAAHVMLGRPYQIHGTVSPGAQRGRELGFPTANLERVVTLLPAEGVYSGVSTVRGERYPAAIHIGPNPTFHDEMQKLEVHLIGFEGEIYGETMAVDFLRKIRDLQTFAGRETLIEQLRQDIDLATKYANEELSTGTGASAH